MRKIDKLILPETRLHLCVVRTGAELCLAFWGGRPKFFILRVDPYAFGGGGIQTDYFQSISGSKMVIRMWGQLKWANGRPVLPEGQQIGYDRRRSWPRRHAKHVNVVGNEWNVSDTAETAFQNWIKMRLIWIKSENNNEQMHSGGAPV